MSVVCWYDPVTERRYSIPDELVVAVVAATSDAQVREILGVEGVVDSEEWL